GVPVFAWKGETLEEYWWCTQQALTWPGHDGPNMILDDGGDATLLVHKGYEFEQAGAVPPVETADTEEYAVVLELLHRSLAEDNRRWTRMAAGIRGVTEETTTGVHRLYEMQKAGTLLFPTAKIYSPHGQNYTPVDRELFLSYREATNGQILHEGITEAGSVASFTAAGTSYATHGEPMIPVYIFYSMFGFQRTGDGLWAAADQLARGFLLGATAGRTTLNGEGLQHEDGHSHLLAATNPAVVAYDPAFA